VAVVTLTPASFSLVLFDAADVKAVIERTADRVGLGPDEPLRVEVDETISLGRIRVASVDPIHLHVESGALEDTKRLRRFGAEQTERELARVLFKVQDRRSGRFTDAPGDDGLALRESIAWDVYAAGRVARIGIDAQKDRRRYAFRNRHGFSDAVDAEFDRLWSAEGLSWADLAAVCARTEALGSGATA
jgi:hypothetical protein